MNNKNLIFSNRKFSFHIIPITNLSYFIQFQSQNIGINNNNNLVVNNKMENNETRKFIWNIHNIRRNQYIIQNFYNNKLIEISDNYMRLSNNQNFYNDKKYIFHFYKLFEKGSNQKKYIKKINHEPIDIVIKYIDLSDKTLNRTGINQIYKDENCEELKYSIRSILQYIPWVRKILLFTKKHI